MHIQPATVMVEKCAFKRCQTEFLLMQALNGLGFDFRDVNSYFKE